MGIGTSIFLVAVGAVLAFAVTADVSGVSLYAVGIILMVAGAIGLAISLAARMRETGDRDPVDDRSHHHA